MASTQQPINGNGAAVRGAHKEEDEENIFLFVPNLIGRSFLLLSMIHVLTDNRIWPCRPCPGFSLLHAPPPTHMHTPLHRIVPP